jgi:hypothetical protein
MPPDVRLLVAARPHSLCISPIAYASARPPPDVSLPLNHFSDVSYTAFFIVPLFKKIQKFILFPNFTPLFRLCFFLFLVALVHITGAPPPAEQLLQVPAGGVFGVHRAGHVPGPRLPRRERRAPPLALLPLPLLLDRRQRRPHRGQRLLLLHQRGGRSAPPQRARGRGRRGGAGAGKPRQTFFLFPSFFFLWVFTSEHTGSW